MKGETLSELIIIDEDLKQGSLNLIEAGCGAGKTYFAVEKLAKKYGADKTVFLIDTVAGKEQLLKERDCIELREKYWSEIQRDYMKDNFEHECITQETIQAFERWLDDQITVMTYGQFAYWCDRDMSSVTKYKCVVCDEIHNLINFIEWGKRNAKNSYVKCKNELALEMIMRMGKLKDRMVVAMTATPNKFLKHTKSSDLIHRVVLRGEVRHYEDNTITHYSNLNLLLDKLDPKQRGMIYTPYIRQMENIIERLNRKGIHAVGIWSTRNETNPMNEEQLEVRRSIVEDRKIPDDVQVLVINKASETSINIETPLDYIIVNSYDEDEQIQARGRLRDDLELLCLYKPDIKEKVVLDEKWLNVPLDKSKKQQLCDELGFRKYGRKCGWPTVKQAIEDSGYTVTPDRTSTNRFDVIAK